MKYKAKETFYGSNDGNTRFLFIEGKEYLSGGGAGQIGEELAKAMIESGHISKLIEKVEKKAIISEIENKMETVSEIKKVIPKKRTRKKRS